MASREAPTTISDTSIGGTNDRFHIPGFPHIRHQNHHGIQHHGSLYCLGGLGAWRTSGTPGDCSYCMDNIGFEVKQLGQRILARHICCWNSKQLSPFQRTWSWPRMPCQLFWLGPKALRFRHTEIMAREALELLELQRTQTRRIYQILYCDLSLERISSCMASKVG